MCVTVIPFCALSCAALHCCCPAGHHSGPDCGLPVGHHHPNSLRGAPGHVPRLTLSPGGQADGLAGRPAGIVAGNSFCRARHLVMCVQQAPAEPPTLHYSRYPLLPAPFHLPLLQSMAMMSMPQVGLRGGATGSGMSAYRQHWQCCVQLLMHACVRACMPPVSHAPSAYTAALSDGALALLFF